MERLMTCARFALACLVVLGAVPADAQTFKVATWNIRSGKGITGLQGFPKTFDSNTSNCNTASLPLNAWGVGVPQRELAALNADPAVVALGLQEAWLCGSPQNVKSALAWKSYVVDNQNGTSIVARHGFAGPVVTRKLTSSATDPNWIVRAPVCLDAACGQSVMVYVTHWAGVEAMAIVQAQETIAFMAEVSEPRLLIGDLNAYVDPPSSCGAGFAVSTLQQLSDAGYIDAWPALYGTLEGFTAVVNRAGCGTPLGSAYKRPDYAWSKGLTPLSMQRFAIPAIAGQEAASDHYGLVTEYLNGSPTVTPPPPPPPPPSHTSPFDEVVLYASRAAIRAGSYQVTSDVTAADGSSLSNPDLGAAKLTAPLPTPSTYFEMTFNAVAGKPYRLWIRGKAQANAWMNDSVYVQFNDSVDGAGAAVFRPGTTSATSVSIEQGSGSGLHGWGWSDNGYGKDGPAIYFKTTGSHTIRVQVREDGLAIDQIVLSSGNYLMTSPGMAKDDTTILPANY
jgi:hypothetical protein